MVFGDDWPGTFIRGDNAAYFAHALRTLLEAHGAVGAVDAMAPAVGVGTDGVFFPLRRSVLEGLLGALEGSRVTGSDDPKSLTVLRPFIECLSLQNVTGAAWDVPLRVWERKHIERVISMVQGNKSKAARVLAMDRRTLYRKIGVWAKEDAKRAQEKD